LSFLVANEYFERIHRVVSLLDTENVLIITAMKQYGPRNLQVIARKTGIPSPTVYARVSKLESQGLLRTWISPDYSKIGLQRAMVLLAPVAGRDSLAVDALKIPGYWLRVTRCIGECNGYFSLHAIPTANRQDFEQYLDQVVASGMASSYRIFWMEEARSPTINFEYYNPEEKVWKFDWPAWLNHLTSQTTPRILETSSSPSSKSFDKKDLLILNELVKNARTKLSDLGRLLNLTLPAVKYRFDHLLQRGFIHDYGIDILPYAPEISDLYEVRLDFKNDKLLNFKERVVARLPFVITYSIVKNANSMSVRAYLPRREMNNLLTLLSALVRERVLNSFSYLLLDPGTIQAQTFSYEYYNDESGWHYDNREYLDALQKAVSMYEKGHLEPISFQPVPIASLQ
jgi:DNA-binding Lrp family transcriptional regulator